LYFIFKAKIHCVADSDCINTPKDIECLPFSIIPKHTELTIRDAIHGQDKEFIKDMVEFGMVVLNISLFRINCFDFIDLDLWKFSTT
jgi:hypothetical protein